MLAAIQSPQRVRFLSVLEMSCSSTKWNFHQWVAQALEQVERAFEKTAKSDKASKLAEAKINALKEQQIRRLQEKLIHKNEGIAELMKENVQAKKANGDL